MVRLGLNLLSLVPGDVGGAQTFVESLIEGLSKNDPLNDDFVVFLNRECRGEFDFPDYFEVVKTPVPASIRISRHFWEQIVLPIQLKTHSIDVLFSPGNVSPIFSTAKNIVTIHDQNYESVPYTMSSLRRWFLSVAVPVSAHLSDHIVTISEFSKGEILENINVSREKITVVHNPLPPTLPEPIDRDSMEIELPEYYILTAGRNYPHKNYDALLRAMTKLPEGMTLVMTGFECAPGDPLWNLAEKLDIQDRIKFCGYVPWESMGAIYSNADIYIHPSKYEGFGFPLLESMYYGTPVAASNAAAIPEVAGDAAVYFDPDSPDDMANTIIGLYQNPEKQRALRKKGRQRVKDFSSDKFARKIVGVCNDVFQQ